MDININIKDINNKPLKIGDKVEILKITDESFNSSLFGVEPGLNGLIDNVYIEPFRGEITYDEKRLMIVISNGKIKIPLSSYMRGKQCADVFSMVKKDELMAIVKEYNLPDYKYETIIKYIKKLSDNERKI